MHECMVHGLGTRDLCGPEGLTTEQFIAAVQDRFRGVEISDLQARYNVASKEKVDKAEVIKDNVDFEAIKGMFDLYDVDNNGTIDVDEFSEMIIKLGVAPKLKDEKKKSF